MGHEFGDEQEKGERACIFHRKRWNEEQTGKSDERDREESSGREKWSIQEDVCFVMSSDVVKAIVLDGTQRVGTGSCLKSPSSPGLLLQAGWACFRQPRRRRLTIRPGGAIIAKIAATRHAPISGTTGPSMSTDTRRSAGNAQRRRIVLSGDRGLS